MIEGDERCIQKKLHYISQLEGYEPFLEDESVEYLYDLLQKVTKSQKVILNLINKKTTKALEKVVVDACALCNDKVPSNYILYCGHGYCEDCIDLLEVDVAASAPKTPTKYRCGVCRKVCEGYVKARNIREEMQVD